MNKNYIKTRKIIFQNNVNIQYLKHAKIRLHSPGLQEERLQTPCAPTSLTLPAASSLRGFSSTFASFFAGAAITEATDALPNYIYKSRYIFSNQEINMNYQYRKPCKLGKRFGDRSPIRQKPQTKNSDNRSPTHSYLSLDQKNIAGKILTWFGCSSSKDMPTPPLNFDPVFIGDGECAV